MENTKTFSIGQVCELLDIKPYNLRYLEKVLELYTERNTMLNRMYTQNDIEHIKNVLNLRKQGLNYEAIKTILKADEIAIENDPVKGEDNIPDVLNAESKNIELFKNMLKDVISDSLNKTIEPKFNELNTKLDKFRNDNDTLKETLLKQQEKHFSDIDIKLTNWRNEHYPPPKKELSFLKKLFK